VARGVGDGMQADSFFAPVSPAMIEGGGEVTLTNSERKAQERSYKELMRLANRSLATPIGVQPRHILIPSDSPATLDLFPALCSPPRKQISPSSSPTPSIPCQ
jgi:hypothetical protein